MVYVSPFSNPPNISPMFYNPISISNPASLNTFFFMSSRNFSYSSWILAFSSASSFSITFSSFVKLSGLSSKSLRASLKSCSSTFLLGLLSYYIWGNKLLSTNRFDKYKCYHVLRNIFGFMEWRHKQDQFLLPIFILTIYFHFISIMLTDE